MSVSTVSSFTLTSLSAPAWNHQTNVQISLKTLSSVQLPRAVIIKHRPKYLWRNEGRIQAIREKKEEKEGGGITWLVLQKKNASRLQKCLSLYRTSQLINKWWWLAWQEQGHLEMFEWEREEGQMHSTRANETWALRFVWFQGYLRSPCPPSHIVGSLRLKKAHFNWKVVGGVIVGTVLLMWGQSCPDVVVKLKKKDNLYCIN